MSFELKSVQGNVAQLEIELEGLTQHQREEEVMVDIKEAVNHIVAALGGYLSVSCSGNINPVSGETGDVVQIYITSLAAPASSGPEIIPTQEGLENSEVQERVQTPSESSQAPSQETVAGGVPSQELPQPPVIESAPTPNSPVSTPVQPVENATVNLPENS